MPKIPKNKSVKEQGTTATPTLFINITKVRSGWYCELYNADGDAWVIVGPAKEKFVVDTAMKFHKFSGLSIYREGVRYDGLRPMMMKGDAKE